MSYVFLSLTVFFALYQSIKFHDKLSHSQSKENNEIEIYECRTCLVGVLNLKISNKNLGHVWNRELNM